MPRPKFHQLQRADYVLERWIAYHSEGKAAAEVHRRNTGLISPYHIDQAFERKCQHSDGYRPI